jgi:succinate dehydrogenase hydrophobic anchor subunit
MMNINVAIKVLLRFASKLERRHDKTDEVISNTFKMFVTQFFNTIILLLLVNFKLGFLPSWFPILGGDYDDFTSQWYSEVGTAILLTMFFSIFGPHLANLGFHSIFAVKRCIDRN